LKVKTADLFAGTAMKDFASLCPVANTHGTLLQAKAERRAQYSGPAL
jgi:hypothetical protein